MPTKFNVKNNYCTHFKCKAKITLMQQCATYSMQLCCIQHATFSVK